MFYLKQSTASQSVLLGPYIDDTDGKTAETGLTIANTDIRLSKNGGNMAAKNSGGGTHDEAGWYAITLNATDTDTVGTLQISSDVSGALPVWLECTVVEEAVYVALYAASAPGPITAAAVNTEVDNSMVTYGLDHLISASVSDTDVADDSIIAQMTDAGSTADYTNFSPTEDSLRAISEKVSGIGSASGGGFNFAAVGDDALTDTINNAEAAVDKSTTPATVGIPVTGHAFLKGHEVTIAGTANYNGSFAIDSVSTNEVVIVSSFTAETFSGSDTIVSSIKATSIEGVQTTNTFASTVSEDGVFHVIDDDGSNNFTISYRYEIGGGRLATEAVFAGFLNSNNDNALLQAYDFVGSAWETRALLTGQNGSVNQTVTISLLARNTGTSGVDLGVVFLRITDDTPRGSSNPTLNTDSLLVEAQGIGQTVGYEGGAIWIDTVDGTAGTESFVNGVADKPVLTLADALTLSSARNLHRFIVAPGSSITFAETHKDQVWVGESWDLALGGQDCDGSHFFGADVTGTATATNEMHFDHCEMGTCTLGQAHIDTCDFEGTITISQAATYVMVNCAHVSGTPTVDFGSGVGSTTVHLHDYHGAITILNMGQSGTDILHFSSGDGKLTLDSTNTGGTKNLNGTFELADSSTGQTTNQGGSAIPILDSILVDTNSLNDGAISELSQAAPSATPTLRNAVMLMYMALRDRVDTTSTVFEIHNDAGTVIAKATVSDDGTTFTRAELESGP